MGLPGDNLGWDGVGRVDLKQFQRCDSIEMDIFISQQILNMYILNVQKKLANHK